MLFKSGNRHLLAAIFNLIFPSLSYHILHDFGLSIFFVCFTFNKALRRKAPVASAKWFSAAATPSGDVVVPEVVDTLEWILDSPPNVHQFDEPPVRKLITS